MKRLGLLVGAGVIGAVLWLNACGGQSSANRNGDGDGDGDGDGGDGDGDDGGDGDGDVFGDGDGGDGDITGPSCRTTDDCAAQNFERCFVPGETFNWICGAPDWCGSCTCGPEPISPEGAGTPCSTEAECPDTPSQEQARVASVCDPTSGSCQECSTDDDCGVEAPHCALESWTNAMQCFECKADDDCSGDRPVCRLATSFGGLSEAGSCVECTTTSGCAEGICDTLSNTCVDQCQTDDDCTNDFTTCQDKRCSAPPCADSAECGENGECIPGGCVRRSCSTDGDCDADGYCVQSKCYDSPGTCQEELAVPGGQ